CSLENSEMNVDVSDAGFLIAIKAVLSELSLRVRFASPSPSAGGGKEQDRGQNQPSHAHFPPSRRAIDRILGGPDSARPRRVSWSRLPAFGASERSFRLRGMNDCRSDCADGPRRTRSR